MKNILKFTFFILIIAIAINCSEEPQAKSLKEYSIENIINNSKPITLSDMGVQLKTIKLKAPKDIIVSGAARVVTTSTSIFIQTYQPLQVFRFDRDGNYMNKISNKGRAKNEYNGITTIFADTNENICVQDRDDFLTFTPEGNYIDSKTDNRAEKQDYALGIGLIYIDKKGNCFKSYLTSEGSEPYNLVVTNPDKDTLLINSNPIKYNRIASNMIIIYHDIRSVYYAEDEIVFQQQYCDTVYTYDQNSNTLKPRFSFKNPTPMTSEEFRNINNKYKKLTFVEDITEDSKYIYVNISNKGKRKLYLIDKKSDESFEADFRLNHPEDNELAFYPKWESNDEYIFFYDVTQNPEPTILLMKKL